MRSALAAHYWPSSGRQPFSGPSQVRSCWSLAPVGVTGLLSVCLGFAAGSQWGQVHLGSQVKQPVILDAGLSMESRFWTGLGQLGQVLPVSRPACSVLGSGINLVPGNYVLLKSCLVQELSIISWKPSFSLRRYNWWATGEHLERELSFPDSSHLLT